MSTVSIPYTFSPGGVEYSANFNSNFTALQTGINNITSAASGIYASDVKPGSTGQATFGSGYVYSMPSGLSVTGGATVAGGVTVTGGLTVSGSISLAGAVSASAGLGVTGGLTSGSAGGYVPEVLTASGVATNSNEHIVRGTVAIGVGNTNTYGQSTITFTNNAVFTSNSTYQAHATYNGQGSTVPNGWNPYNVSAFVFQQSASSLTIYVISGGATATNSGTLNVNWTAIGY